MSLIYDKPLLKVFARAKSDFPCNLVTKHSCKKKIRMGWLFTKSTPYNWQWRFPSSYATAIASSISFTKAISSIIAVSFENSLSSANGFSFCSNNLYSLMVHSDNAVICIIFIAVSYYSYSLRFVSLNDQIYLYCWVGILKDFLQSLA